MTECKCVMFYGMKKLILALLAGALLLFGFYSCPIDNLTMNWTGRTRFESGVMLKEYRCVRGHIAWGR